MGFLAVEDVAELVGLEQGTVRAGTESEALGKHTALHHRGVVPEVLDVPGRASALNLD